MSHLSKWHEGCDNKFLRHRVFRLRTVMKLKRQIVRGRRLYYRIAASTVTEYAVIIAIVSIAAVAVMVGIGKQTNNLLNKMNTNMP